MKSKKYLIIITIVSTLFFLKGEIIISHKGIAPIKTLLDSAVICSNISTQNDLLINKTIRLKVLLVEFEDVKHRQPDYPTSLSLPAYTYDDFNNMLFSSNRYFSPNMYSPDGEKVYGSLRDYYRVMSNNNLDIVGSVLNNDLNSNNIPDWIKLDKTKKFYDDGRVEQMINDSKKKAKQNGLNIKTNDTTFLTIIYAGHTYRSYTLKNLTPQAFIKKHEYITGERFAASGPYREERDDPNICAVAKFSHIGIHAHEFAHLLGFEHHGGGLDNQYWCLMSAGNYNGPKNKGACPAPLNPYLRWMKGWTTFESYNGDTTRVLKYNLKEPIVYKIKDDLDDNFFLVEFRMFNSQMALGEKSIIDYNSFIKNVSANNGILIWRKLVGNYVKLLYSSGFDCADGDNHLFPGNCAVKVISPWSDNRVCKPGLFWVPNTKPSLNCGIEIISVEKDKCTIDFYQKDPLNSSPSSPKKLVNISDSNVVLEWKKNNEPDLDYYKIYKLNSDSIYEQIDISYTPFYRDFDETVDNSSNVKNYVYYKITSIDSTNKESCFSNEVKVPVTGITGLISNKIIKSRPDLHQNYPNPFNPSTTIKYSMTEEVKNVILKIYDILGKEVATLVNEKQRPGKYEVDFDGSWLTSGIYFYRLQANDFVNTKKMILIK